MTMDWIGWVATAIFLSSYRCKHPAALRRVQALAAGLWVVYGAIIHATPVIVANLLVAGIAIYSSLAPPKKLEVKPATALPGAPGSGT
ncbi:MAG: hypothetical protein ACREMZ_12995 [Gemmatimonadales bacterium]